MHAHISMLFCAHLYQKHLIQKENFYIYTSSTLSEIVHIKKEKNEKIMPAVNTYTLH